MKMKIVIVLVGSAIVGSSIFIGLSASHHRATRERQSQQSQERVSNAVSNYAHKFKLNTAPAIFPEQPNK